MERFRNLPEEEARLQTLPLLARCYLSVGKAAITPNVNSEVTVQLKSRQLELLSLMSLEDRAALTGFLDWRNAKLIPTRQPKSFEEFDGIGLA